MVSRIISDFPTFPTVCLMFPAAELLGDSVRLLPSWPQSGYRRVPRGCDVQMSRGWCGFPGLAFRPFRLFRAGCREKMPDLSDLTGLYWDFIVVYQELGRTRLDGTGTLH